MTTTPTTQAHDHQRLREERPEWQIGDWHCLCGAFGSHDWMGYAFHLEHDVLFAIAGQQAEARDTSGLREALVQTVIDELANHEHPLRGVSREYEPGHLVCDECGYDTATDVLVGEMAALATAPPEPRGWYVGHGRQDAEPPSAMSEYNLRKFEDRALRELLAALREGAERP